MKGVVIHIMTGLALCCAIFTNSAYAQKWNSMDDSTYQRIVANRFNKGNIYTGIGGTIKTDYDTLNFIGVGVRPYAGYFVAERWLLFAGFNYYYSWVRESYNDGKGTFQRFLFGITARHYFKPRHRTIFIQLGPLIGTRSQNMNDIANIDSYHEMIYGVNAGVGVSVFVRRFEMELLAGFQIYGNNYSAENIESFMYQLLQINLSYIFDKKRKKQPPLINYEP